MITFRLMNERDEVVPVSLNVVVIFELGTTIFSVGVRHEKGVNLDTLPTSIGVLLCKLVTACSRYRRNYRTDNACASLDFRRRAGSRADFHTATEADP